MIVPVEAKEFDELKKHFFDYIDELLPYEPDRNITNEQSWELQVDPRVYKFWVKYAGEKIGFCFLCWNSQQWELTQFYIFPEFRHKGRGTMAVKNIKRAFKGNILIGVLKDNPALHFWRTFNFDFLGFDDKEGMNFYNL